MSGTIDLHFHYSPRQKLFLLADQPVQGYGGAKGGGKSWALCQKAIKLAIEFPGNRIGLFRQDLTDLKKTLLVTFLRVCPHDLIIQHNKTDHWFDIFTGKDSPPSRIIYSGLGDHHEIESVKGMELGAFGIDEPSEIDPATYRMILAQLRWRLPDGRVPPYQAMLCTNPEPGWVEELFRDLIIATNDSRPIASDARRVFIRALPSDNPYLDEDTLSFMRDMPPTWRKKYMEGSWEAAEGQVYAEFDRGIHCIRMPHSDYLATLKLVASVDHATTGITCMTIDGIDRDGNVIALAEYYERNRLISEHAKAMHALMDRWVDICGLRKKVFDAAEDGMYPATRAFEYILIDPSTQAKTLQNRTEFTSVQDEYIRHGIPVRAAWNAVEAGINLMSEYIHPKPKHIHPLRQTSPSPSFFIIESENPSGIREIIGWRRTLGPNGKPKYSGADHWLDNQRYIIMSRPEPPRITTRDLDRMSTMDRIATRDLARLDSKFPNPSKQSSQWFPGGSGGSNQWFPRPD